MASALHPGRGCLCPHALSRDATFCVSRAVFVKDWRRKMLDKFGGTSTIDASIMVFGLLKFCVSTWLWHYKTIPGGG